MKFIHNKLNNKEHKRIFDKISIDKESGCWEWKGSKDSQGYGLLWFKGRTERIHRVLYSVFVKAVPKGKTVRKISQVNHLCNNTSCCNPKHLELISQKENVLKGNGITAKNSRKTHCPKGHPYPKYNGKARKYCKKCDSIRHKERLQGPKREYWLRKGREAVQRYKNKNNK